MNKMIVSKDYQELRKPILIDHNEKNRCILNNEENIIEVKDQVVASLTILGEDVRANVHIHLGKNSKLEVYHIVLDGQTKIKVDLDENSEIEYHVAGIGSKEAVVAEVITHSASNTKSNFYNHALSLNETFSFQVDGIVPKSSKGCICNQENKIICLSGGKGEIKPNLYIENYDVVANHSAFVGRFDKDTMFFLASRGLSLESSYQLLVKGFLFEKMELKEETYQKILEKVKIK